MNKKLFSMAVILTLIAASFFSAGGARQPAFVGQALAAETTLAAEAGIAAYVNLGSPINLGDVNTAFLSIEYQALDGSFLIGLVDASPFSDEYDPYVLVHTSGWILAYYPKINSAGNTSRAAKLVDVIGRSLEKTLLEKAVETVAAKGGFTGLTINHYDFANPNATKMLLVAEYQADGNTFTLNMPSENTYYEKSYAFYRSFEPSFTLDSELVDQVNFVTTNADYNQSIVYGTIYGHFDENQPVNFGTDTTYTFSVWNRDFYAFGALAIEYSGDGEFTIADADYVKEYPLGAPEGLPVITFDFTPTAFVKLTDNPIAYDKPLDILLDWEDSTAPNYEYCIDRSAPDTNPLTEDCETKWISTGSATSVALSNLFYDTTYYWQVRAVNSTATIYADAGAWASFTTANGVAPVEFAKYEELLVEKPGSSSKVTLSWKPSYGAYYYEYCIDTTSSCIAPEVWHNVGLATTVSTSDLKFDTTYYWQVRAWNGYDPDGAQDPGYYTYAGPDAAWNTFDTRNFGKLRPTDNALVSPSLVLEWEPSDAPDRYEYCVSTTDNACPTNGWVSVGLATKATVTKLDYETTYFWQVRAVKGSTNTYANLCEIVVEEDQYGEEVDVTYCYDEGAWWTFTTNSKKKPTPTLFKVSPVDGTVDVSTKVTLDWKDYKPKNSYEYCYFDIDDTDTTPISDDDHCTLQDENWTPTGTTSQVTGLNLTPGTTYYWQVRVNLGTDDVPIWVYADKDEYWSFTTAP